MHSKSVIVVRVGVAAGGTCCHAAGCEAGLGVVVGCEWAGLVSVRAGVGLGVVAGCEWAGCGAEHAACVREVKMGVAEVETHAGVCRGHHTACQPEPTRHVTMLIHGDSLVKQ